MGAGRRTRSEGRERNPAKPQHLVVGRETLHNIQGFGPKPGAGGGAPGQKKTATRADPPAARLHCANSSSSCPPMAENPIPIRPPADGVGAAARRYLLRGFLFWIPVAAVVLVGRIVYGLISSWFFPSLGWEPRLTALVVVALTLIATGWAVTRFRVAQYVARVVIERPLMRVPVARWVYSGVRQLLDALFTSGDAFGKVVLIQYPRQGVYSIAFQMAGQLAEVQHGVRMNGGDPSDSDDPRDVMAVFVPTTPNPTSGVVVTLPRDEAIELQMTRQEALQMIISLGVVVPPWRRPEEQPPAPAPAD